MSVHVDVIGTDHPFFSVQVVPTEDINEELSLEFSHLQQDTYPEALVINYDEAVVVVGDLKKFGLDVLRVTNPEIYEALGKLGLL